MSAFWERGSPDLPACGPRRGSTSWPVRPIFTSQHSRPSRGAKPREGDVTRPPRERSHQASSRGAERSRQGKPRELPMTRAMTIKARRAPGGRQRVQCPRFLFGAKEGSACEESRGIRQRFPYRCNETKTSRTEVTMEPKTASPPEPLAGEDCFCQDNLF